MEKLFYSIGEGAQELGESTSLVRFWTNSFPKLISPRRNAKGNRQFTKDDLETFRQIHFLVKHEGLTLEGAAKRMSHDRHETARRMKVLQTLKEIRSQLVEISEGL